MFLGGPNTERVYDVTLNFGTALASVRALMAAHGVPEDRWVRARHDRQEWYYHGRNIRIDPWRIGPSESLDRQTNVRVR